MKTKKDTRLFLHLKKWLEKASLDYGMIEEGDNVLVGVSGGRDSLVLLELLSSPMLFLPPFKISIVHIDHGFDPSYQSFNEMERLFKKSGKEYIIKKTDIGPVAHSAVNTKNPCFLCSRLRRKEIFTAAEELKCNKIALGHHKDDIIETLLINMFYGREISTMVPNQPVFGGKYHLVRPLAYLEESVVKRYAMERGFPLIENACPTAPSSRRAYIKELLKQLEKDNKDIRENIFKSMSHVKPDYLIKKAKPENENSSEKAEIPSTREKA
ncbi:MAG: ATP-binding protein [Syntrophales bacterium]|nr:ATP-binding protein [Syntrophales bacterium]